MVNITTMVIIGRFHDDSRHKIYVWRKWLFTMRYFSIFILKKITGVFQRVTLMKKIDTKHS